MNHPQDDAIDALLRKQFHGPVRDDGFVDRVMQQLPSRRRITWPLWTGLIAGVALTWFGLTGVPVLPIGLHDLMGGMLSTPAVMFLVAMAGMSMLTCCWTLTEPS